MARRGPPTVPIIHPQRGRACDLSSSQALALRCRIVLACNDGDRTRDEIAGVVGCNPGDGTKWRHRFATDRLDGLIDAPRPGAKRTIGDDVAGAPASPARNCDE